MLTAAHWRRFCAVVLILFALAPSFATRDDESSIVSLFFNSNPHDDLVSAVRKITPANFDCDLSASPGSFDEAQVSPLCVFHIEISSAFLNPTTTITHKNRSLTVAVGRAPPTA